MPRKTVFAFVGVILGIVLALYLWLPMRHAWWYVTDDYRWPTLLGADGKITFRELLKYSNPPDYPLGSNVNRPTYFFSTSLFMYLFGVKIVWWNLGRIAIMAVSLGAIGFVVTRTCNLVIAAVTIGLLGTHELWIDALLRLQSELFIFLGLALVGLFSHLVVGRSFPTLSPVVRGLLLAALTLASLYATGSKENITVLMLGLSAAVLLMSFLPAWTWLGRLRVPAACTLAWSGVIVACIYRGVLLQGSDLYGNKLVSDSIGPLVAGYLKTDYWAWAALGVTLLFGVTAKLLQRKHAVAYAIPSLGLCLITQLCIVGFGVFLVFFYRGVIPASSRYQLPFAFLPLIALLVLGSWLMRLGGPRLFRALAVTVATTLVLGYGYAAVRGKNLKANREMALVYSKATEDFHQRLEALFVRARAQPDRPILFKSHALNDTEPLASVELFSRAYGLRNPIYLEIIGYSAATTHSPSELNLYMITTGFVTSGRFYAAAELSPNAHPIIANFSQTDLSNGAVGNYWPLW